MINIDKLKPILEPLLNDENSVEVIEAIQAIDEPGVTQADIDAVNKNWQEKFRKAFFAGDTGTEPEPEGGSEGGEEDEPEEKTRYEDLFEEE